jgi:hypothetical protein
MSHTAEGSLQTYLDGELDSAAAAELDQHLAVCDACARELESLRSLSFRASEAFALLDVAPPMLRAQAAIAAARRDERSSFARFAASGLAKAAMLTLVLAGAAAAIPGSPLRRVIERLFSRDDVAVDVPATAPSDVTPAPAVEMEEHAAYVSPANNAVRVVIHAPAGAVDVVVRLIDTDRAEVETSSSQTGVRFRSATGRLEIVGMGAGTVTIGVPRDLAAARIEVNGAVHAFKQGSALHLSGPAGTAQGSEVKFRIEP